MLYLTRLLQSGHGTLKSYLTPWKDSLIKASNTSWIKNKIFSGRGPCTLTIISVSLKWKYTTAKHLKLTGICINQTLNNDKKLKIFVNITCINWTPVYSKHILKKNLNKYFDKKDNDRNSWKSRPVAQVVWILSQAFIIQQWEYPKGIQKKLQTN